MKTIEFPEEEGGREAWLNWRLGKITGSRMGDTGLSKTGFPKVGNYKLIAESWIGSQALLDEDTDPMAAMRRGTRLEKEAIERFRKETGKKVDDSLLGWERDDDSRIALSPDGVIGKTGAVEVKCLSAARHIEAFITKQVPKDYWPQVIQYFVTNDSLRSLFFEFYDPRFPEGLDFFFIEIKRKDVKDEVEQYLQQERDTLKWVREKVNELTQYVKVKPKPEAVHMDVVEVEDEPISNLERVAAGIKARSFDV